MAQQDLERGGPESLLRIADKTLYQAKALGRSRIVNSDEIEPPVVV